FRRRRGGLDHHGGRHHGGRHVRLFQAGDKGFDLVVTGGARREREIAVVIFQRGPVVVQILLVDGSEIQQGGREIRARLEGGGEKLRGVAWFAQRHAGEAEAVVSLGGRK